MKKNILLILLMSVTFLGYSQSKKEFYELRIYELKFGTPRSNIENYFKNALFPALNKYGVKNIGAFGEMGASDPAKIYVFIPYSSIEEYAAVNAKIKTDADFIKATQEYNALPPEKAPYARFTTSLMHAFDGIPQLVKPTSEQKLFELRTYESYSEDAARRKIKMFNDEELKIFRDTKLNSVFFGEVVAGEHMPCLTYMLAFKNMEERDANWKNFSANADWKRISGATEYANTVSHIIRVFLVPLSYSQL
ncbi:NIPSNAP family containing protein [Emticicia oligotrophica DSM 17448]|uniref:NIPSNAP family containing protein n=1 Tax=Emticicia oligotrophica (strain DSM 17448 / CIP 109782 / MTCC 6937 / GPTSA100-15) TaxID=929562 RepID=A0ABN4ARV2_EMTOG|nr:NIPSNAP family protein [Emticicia oligotrophica]AFK05278.1 NIPSNAP family containing protein [Emticicia oligotrophica DSM 17448]